MRRAALCLVGVVLAASLAAPLAEGELSQDGDLVVSFDSSLVPTRLPRDHPRPVAITVAGGIRTATPGAPLPQLRTISVAINRAGRLDDRGLPTCRVHEIQPATEAAARALCQSSIVGSGDVTVEVHLDNQVPFLVHGKLLAFNGPTVHGHKQILAQVYSKTPPGAFVLTFTLHRQRGMFGTVMSTSLPAKARAWAYLKDFRMKLGRRFHGGGRARSFVSAACSAPAGFPGAVFPFARATYGFADGRQLTTTTVRSCQVKG